MTPLATRDSHCDDRVCDLLFSTNVRAVLLNPDLVARDMLMNQLACKALRDRPAKRHGGMKTRTGRIIMFRVLGSSDPAALMSESLTLADHWS